MSPFCGDSSLLEGTLLEVWGVGAVGAAQRGAMRCVVREKWQ